MAVIKPASRYPWLPSCPTFSWSIWHCSECICELGTPAFLYRHVSHAPLYSYSINIASVILAFLRARSFPRAFECCIGVVGIWLARRSLNFLHKFFSSPEFGLFFLQCARVTPYLVSNEYLITVPCRPNQMPSFFYVSNWFFLYLPFANLFVPYRLTNRHSRQPARSSFHPFPYGCLINSFQVYADNHGRLSYAPL